MIEDIKSFMKDIEMLNKKLEAQDKIINTQVLEIARLKEQKYMKNGVFSLEYDKETLKDMVLELQERIDKAIEYIKNNRKIETYYTPEQRWEIKKDFIKGYCELLEILGDKENDK